MKQCPKCGKMLNDSMAFCTQCGTPSGECGCPTCTPAAPAAGLACIAARPIRAPARPAALLRTCQPGAEHRKADGNLAAVFGGDGCPERHGAVQHHRVHGGHKRPAGDGGHLSFDDPEPGRVQLAGGIRPAGRHRLAVHRGVPRRDLGGQCPAILIAVGLWLIYLAEAGKISTATKNTGFTPRQDQHHHQSGREHSGPGRGGNFGYHDHRNRGKIPMTPRLAAASSLCCFCWSSWAWAS